jgi:hypothetical protein
MGGLSRSKQYSGHKRNPDQPLTLRSAGPEFSSVASLGSVELYGCCIVYFGKVRPQDPGLTPISGCVKWPPGRSKPSRPTLPGPGGPTGRATRPCWGSLPQLKIWSTPATLGNVCCRGVGGSLRVPFLCTGRGWHAPTPRAPPPKAWRPKGAGHSEPVRDLSRVGGQDFGSQASTLVRFASTHFLAAASGVSLSSAMDFATSFWSSFVHWKFFTSW